MYVARLFYDSMGGVGLYVQGLFSSAAIFIFFYWAKFLKKSEFLNWDVFLILGFYGKVADMIGDTYGLLILKSIIEQG